MNALLTAATLAGSTDPEVVKSAAREASVSGQSVVDVVLEKAALGEHEFLKALADELRWPWLTELSPDLDEAAELKKECPPRLALRHRLMPLAFTSVAGSGAGASVEEGADAGGNQGKEQPSSTGKGALVLACYDPFDLMARQAVARTVSLPVRWALAPREELLRALQSFYGVGADTFEDLMKSRDQDLDDEHLRDEANVIDEDDAEASVLKFVNQIIREALAQRATDIHVEPLHDNLRIRYRIDGVLHETPVPENIKALQASVLARIKVMAKLDIAEKRLPQDGRINLKLEGQSIDVRVACIPSVEGESISLRLLGQERFTLEKLGLTEDYRHKVESLLAKPNGIVLVTGPTGSGKSTLVSSSYGKRIS